MPYPQFDRSKLLVRPLTVRYNKVKIERDAVPPETAPRPLSAAAQATLEECVQRIREARANRRSVMLVFGAHTIKNGLAPVLIRLMEQGWVTLLATNGAGIIHDWEFSFQGLSSEDVKANVDQGQFGIWQETGLYLNLALAVGAYEGLGYGESVGKMICQEGLHIPSQSALLEIAHAKASEDPTLAASALDLLEVTRERAISEGFLAIPHPYQRFSAQAAAYRLGIPFTAHPMIGHDIIYNHAMNRCACVGRAAERDFLTFAESVSRLTDGVYISLGSAVMSPMVYEKSLSITQNVAIQRGERIQNHFIVVADLAKSSWDWTKGEPPQDNPDYYLRYNKTFSRMGGTMRYVSIDNRDFLLHLFRALAK